MIGVLAESDLFRGLNGEDIELIIGTLAEKFDFHKGQYIFYAEDRPKYMYILLSGQVSVFRENYWGSRELLKDFSCPGEVFGEVYLYLDIDSYDFSCLCHTDVQVLAISRDFFGKILDYQGQIGQVVVSNYLRILSKKAFFFNQKIRTMSGSTIRVKLARYILDHARDSVVRLRYNREDLADYLGISRPSLSRELNSMKRDGLVDLTPGEIIILDRKNLKKLY